MLIVFKRGNVFIFRCGAWQDFTPLFDTPLLYQLPSSGNAAINSYKLSNEMLFYRNIIIRNYRLLLTSCRRDSAKHGTEVV